MGLDVVVGNEWNSVSHCSRDLAERAGVWSVLWRAENHPELIRGHHFLAPLESAIAFLELNREQLRVLNPSEFDSFSRFLSGLRDSCQRHRRHHVHFSR